MSDAIVQIVVADVSMSLDNVLAVAGVARSDLWVLVVGLGLSVAFMGLAAALIARLLNRHPWVAYVGLAVILYVAARMVWDGAVEVLAAATQRSCVPADRSADLSIVTASRIGKRLPPFAARRLVPG